MEWSHYLYLRAKGTGVNRNSTKSQKNNLDSVGKCEMFAMLVLRGPDGHLDQVVESFYW